MTQADAKAMLVRCFPRAFASSPRLLDVFDHTEIETRFSCMPLDWYAAPRDFGERNARYLEHAVGLAAEAARRTLASAGWRAADVDHVVLVSSTGVATPSLDARLAGVLGLRPDVRRTPVWGLGCAGGVAGLARARDFARAEPRSRVLMVAVELCSLAFQRHDASARHLVASALFSDGAAAVAVAGARRPPAEASAEFDVALEIEATSSTLWPGTLDVMGWDVDGDGLHVVFSRDIPALVRERFRPLVESLPDVRGRPWGPDLRLVAHPGGAKVLQALEQTLELPADVLRHSRDVLRTCGNMSSPTCLFVLDRHRAAGDWRPGQRAVIAALGPGFSAEMVLVRAVSR